MVDKWHDFGNFSACRRGRQGNDGSAALTHRCAADKVYLSADTAELHPLHYLRIDLPHQINLNGGIDGNHVIILCNHIGVIDMLHPMQLKAGVIIQKIIQSLRACREGRNAFAAVQCFLFIIDDTCFNQVDNAIRRHFGMQTQILFIL